MKTYVHKGAHPAHVTQPVPSVRQLSCLGGAAQPCAQIRSTVRRPALASQCLRQCRLSERRGRGDRAARRPHDTAQHHEVLRARRCDAAGVAGVPRRVGLAEEAVQRVARGAPGPAGRADRRQAAAAVRAGTAPHRPHANRLSARAWRVRVRVRVRAASWHLGFRHSRDRRCAGSAPVARGACLGVLGRAGVVVEGQRWSTLHRTDGRLTAACADARRCSDWSGALRRAHVCAGKVGE